MRANATQTDSTIKLKRGLELPISGRPVQAIAAAPAVRSVALVGFDYVGMKPTLAVRVGERVKRGQLLFTDKLSTDKKGEGVRYTAPAAGTVSAINRGARRVLQSVVIDVQEGVQGDQQNTGGQGDLQGTGGQAAREDAITFPTAADPRTLSADAIRATLVESGQWPALRTRPFGKVPAPGGGKVPAPVGDGSGKGGGKVPAPVGVEFDGGSGDKSGEPAAIFITAIDTHPLAPDPAPIIAEQPDAFALGQDLLAKLTPGSVHVCTAPDARLPRGSAGNITVTAFDGPHPAGLAGTHIHFLEPVGGAKTVWTVGYQDVIAIGRLFLDGTLYTERVVSLAGPQVREPRLLRTRLGADLHTLCAGQLKAGENRIISGSVLGGRRVQTGTAWLGRYHNQVSVLQEGTRRELLGWLSPGLNKHSNLPIYLSKLLPKRLLPMTTSTNGSERAMVPVGSYEDVMPLDVLPTQLLRALIVGDTEMAQALGCLELDEEDLALCSYVCPGKYEYGPILRDNLARIEREG